MSLCSLHQFAFSLFQDISSANRTPVELLLTADDFDGAAADGRECGRSTATLRDSLEFLESRGPRLVYIENVGKAPMARIVSHLQERFPSYQWTGVMSDALDFMGSTARIRMYILGIHHEVALGKPQDC